MTKRQYQTMIRRQERQAVAMFKAGKTMKQIKRRTSVDGFIVRGLVMADALSTRR